MTNDAFHIALSKLRHAGDYGTVEEYKRRQIRYLVVCSRIETAEGRHGGFDDLGDAYVKVRRYDNSVFLTHDKVMEGRA